MADFSSFCSIRYIPLCARIRRECFLILLMSAYREEGVAICNPFLRVFLEHISSDKFCNVGNGEKCAESFLLRMQCTFKDSTCSFRSFMEFNLRLYREWFPDRKQASNDSLRPEFLTLYFFFSQVQEPEQMLRIHRGEGLLFPFCCPCRESFRKERVEDDVCRATIEPRFPCQDAGWLQSCTEECQVHFRLLWGEADTFECLLQHAANNY